jgi:hypothetical protein
MARARRPLAAAARLQRTWLEACEAWFGAHAVIAHRTWLMAAATGRPLSAAEGAELTRMVHEKVEAALAAAPAAARTSARMHGLLLQAAHKEAAAASSWALQVAACTSPLRLQRLMGELIHASNGRSSAASAALANAWAAGLLSTWAPFGVRIRRNARRLGKPGGAGRPRRRARRGRS